MWTISYLQWTFIILIMRIKWNFTLAFLLSCYRTFIFSYCTHIASSMVNTMIYVLSVQFYGFKGKKPWKAIELKRFLSIMHVQLDYIFPFFYLSPQSITSDFFGICWHMAKYSFPRPGSFKGLKSDVKSCKLTLEIEYELRFRFSIPEKKGIFYINKDWRLIIFPKIRIRKIKWEKLR